MIQKIKKIIDEYYREDNSRDLFSGAATFFFIQIISAVFLFFVHVILARLLGPSQYGVYSYAMAWFILLLLVAQIGMCPAIIKLFATYQASRQWGRLKGLLIRTSQIGFLSGLLTGLILLFATHSGLLTVDSESKKIYSLGVLLLPAMVLLSLRMAALRSMRRIANAFVPEGIIRPLLFVLLIYSTFKINDAGLSVYQAVYCYLAATVITLLLCHFFYQIHLRPEVKKCKPEYETKRWLSFALPFMIMAFMETFLTKSDILILGWLRSDVEVGIYSAILKISTLSLFGFHAVTVIVAPIISDLYAQKKNSELQRIIKLSAIGLLAMFIPSFIALALSGSFLLGLFNDVYREGYFSLIIIMCGKSAYILFATTGSIMLMTGQQNAALRFTAIALGSNIILNLILIPRYGIVGAAMATALVTLVLNFSFSVYIKKNLNLRTVFLPTLIFRAKQL